MLLHLLHGVFVVWFLLQLNTDPFPSHALIKSNSSLESQQHCLTTVPLCISFTVAHLHGLHLHTALLKSEIIFLRASSAHLYTHVLLHLHSVFSMTDYAALCYECSEYESYKVSQSVSCQGPSVQCC